VDLTLDHASDAFRVLFSNKVQPAPPNALQRFEAGSVAVQERVGSSGGGPLNCVFVALAPLEVPILRRP
jgi:hypothetical protein